jgi:hypothetical protein
MAKERRCPKCEELIAESETGDVYKCSSCGYIGLTQRDAEIAQARAKRAALAGRSTGTISGSREWITVLSCVGVFVVVVAAFGGAIYYLIRTGDRTRTEGASRLSGVGVSLSMTYGEMVGSLGRPSFVTQARTGGPNGGGILIRNGQEVGWYGIVRAEFVAASSDIADDSRPIRISIVQPFKGSLEGIHLGGSCKEVYASFRPSNADLRASCDEEDHTVKEVTVFDSRWEHDWGS